MVEVVKNISFRPGCARNTTPGSHGCPNVVSSILVSQSELGIISHTTSHYIFEKKKKI